MWWKTTEESLPPGAKLLSIILYSDATTTDTLGKNQLHPIYVSIGNIPTWRRNKQDAKQLLGYLPILEAANDTEKKLQTFKNIVRKIFHDSLQHILKPVFSEDGIDLSINNETFWFYPCISVIIADWQEASTFCLTYKSSISNFPCHFCLVSRDNLANINLLPSDIELSTHESMCQYFENNNENLV